MNLGPVEHIFVLTFGWVCWVLGAIANPPKSEDKYVEKVFNWSEVHLSEMTCYKIHTLDDHFSCQITMGTFLDSAICKNNTLCCCHGRQLFVEDHPHHALHPASNSLARLSSLVRLARLRPSATSMLHTIQYFRKSPHILQVPRLDPDPYTRIAHIICNSKKN